MIIINNLKSIINNFWVALSFFTQIPVPKTVQYSDNNLKNISLYFVIIGWLLGGMAIGVFYISYYLFNVDIAIWLSIIFSIIITGALHEDGLADCCDGFAGGFTAEKKMKIMKDSQIGTYACLSLIIAIFGKYLLLSSQNDIYLAILVAAPLSRAFAISYMFDLSYVSLQNSKSQQHVKQLSKLELLIIISSTLPLLFLLKLSNLLMLVSLLFLIRIFLKQLFLRQIKGYNGDCIGASQQIFELSIYLILLLTIMQ